MRETYNTETSITQRSEACASRTTPRDATPRDIAPGDTTTEDTRTELHRHVAHTEKRSIENEHKSRSNKQRQHQGTGNTMRGRTNDRLRQHHTARTCSSTTTLMCLKPCSGGMTNVAWVWLNSNASTKMREPGSTPGVTATLPTTPNLKPPNCATSPPHQAPTQLRQAHRMTGKEGAGRRRRTVTTPRHLRWSRPT
jgi:hypothetical protein